MKVNNTISENIQELLRVKQVEEGLHILSFCRKNNLSEEIAEGLSADVADLLQCHTDHLHLDADQIAELVQHDDKEAHSLRPFRRLLNTYFQTHMLLQSKVMARGDVGKEALFEFKRRCNIKDGDDLNKLKDLATTERHIWLVSFLRSLNVYEHEILAIVPTGCSQELARIIPIVEQDAVFIKILKGKVEVTPELLDFYRKQGVDVASVLSFFTKSERQQIVNTWQNCSEMLSKNTTVADIGTGGQGTNKRPLLLALNEDIKDLDRPSQKYIYQAFNCANIISSLWKPIADGDEKATYKSTLREITKILTGNDDPVQYQIEETYAALAFISTKMFQFTEYVCKKKPTRKRGRPKAEAEAEANPNLPPTEIDIVENGEKVRYEAYRVLTNPMTVTLRQNLKEGEKVKGNMEVTLDIHHIITEGRRASQITLPNGKTAFVKKPARHLTTLKQLQEWVLPAEQRFLHTILKCSHMNEKDLMEGIFDYDNRLLLAEVKDKENTARTEEHSNKTAVQKERRNQQNHRSRDKDELCNMFIRAKETGLISWYLNYTTNIGGKSVMVWKWGRPEGETRKKCKIPDFIMKKK